MLGGFFVFFLLLQYFRVLIFILILVFIVILVIIFITLTIVFVFFFASVYVSGFIVFHTASKRIVKCISD
jgi:hypothetical protein